MMSRGSSFDAKDLDENHYQKKTAYKCEGFFHHNNGKQPGHTRLPTLKHGVEIMVSTNQEIRYSSSDKALELNIL